MWRIYLDTCCLNRPFDDETQDRIRLEAEAVRLIMAHVQAGEWEWITSTAIDVEIAQVTDPARKQLVQSLLQHARHHVLVGQSETDRMKELEGARFHSLDALHIACAEAGRADLFLTTDDRLLRRAVRHRRVLRVRVANPLAWIEEVMVR